MSNSYNYNPSTSTHGKYVQQMVSAIDNMLAFGLRNMNMFTQMLDGDGSQDAHYATFKTRVGCTTDAEARALYAELTSGWAKVSGDGPVSAVNVALKQLVARATV